MKILAKVGVSTWLYMKKFHKSQQDPNPSRHLLQIDCTRVDPLRWVEANPGSCKGGLRALGALVGLAISSPFRVLLSDIMHHSFPQCLCHTLPPTVKCLKFQKFFLLMMSEVQWTTVKNVVFFSKGSTVIKLPAIFMNLRNFLCRNEMSVDES